MTVTVSLTNEEQEKALIEFLEKMHYNYQSDSVDLSLTEVQKQEVLKRDNAFINGNTTARDWNDIKHDLESVYR
jgi:hypothetical protein